jgi:hypothetical protein
MLRLFFVALGLLCLSSLNVAQAQTAPSPEAVKMAQELAMLMTGDTVKQTSRALTAQIWPVIENRFSQKVDAPTLADLKKEFERSLSEFSAEAIKDAPEVYARYFSVKELRDMLAFYHSPTGAKALKVMPMVLSDVSARIAPRMQSFQQVLNERISMVMKKHGYAN